MYNVLIVEDEILVSIGLKNMINWSEMGMQVIAEAQDGKTAFEIYKEQKPDLILTDIKMPVMDGLELIAKIRETDKKTKIIILTCYQEFDLIHKALKLGVSDYILKLKMSVSEMESVIMKVHDELVTTDAVQLENISLPIVQLAKNQFLLDYVLHGSFTDAAFEKMISGMHLRIDSSRLVLCVMRISNFESVNRQPDGDPKNTVADTILNLVDKLLAKYLRGEVVRQNDGQYLIIFSFGDIVSETKRTELLYSILSRISVNMKTYINASVTFGISLCRDGYSCLRELYNQAIEVLEQYYYFTGDIESMQFGNQSYKNDYLSIMQSFHAFIANHAAIASNYRKEILLGLQKMEVPALPQEKIKESFIQ